MGNGEEKEEPIAVITWQNGKTTKYHREEFHALKKSSPDGYLRFNPTTNAYERPKNVDVYLQPSSLSSKRKQRLEV